ncbi:MAG: hypothetical protein ACYC5X_04095 [Syntrophales bacterium]
MPTTRRNDLGRGVWHLNIVAGMVRQRSVLITLITLGFIILSSISVNSFEQEAADSNIHSVRDGICGKSRHRGTG